MGKVKKKSIWLSLGISEFTADVESETDFFQFRDKKHDDEKKIKTRMLKSPENLPGPIHFLSFAVQKKRFIKYLQSLQ